MLGIACQSCHLMDATATSPQSFLEVLKAPQTSELTRRRRIDRNPPIGRKKSRGQGFSVFVFIHFVVFLGIIGKELLNNRGIAPE